MSTTSNNPQTGADALLSALGACGIDYLFANAGTDFPPVIEALASLDPSLVPTPVTVPHETAAVAMAHGYYLATGRMQAVMVHVNVGLANAALGVINAASDNIPVLVMSGRTPLTEGHRKGARASPIQYGQEMYDQTSLVRDVVKFSYEMRYPEQAGPLVARAATLARANPSGPVYLSLPREPLCDTVPEGAEFSTPPASAAFASPPDPTAIALLAKWLGDAAHPLILCQRGDTAGRLGPALSGFAHKHGAAVVEPFSIRNVLASDDPALQGYAPGPQLKEADLVIVLDSGVPWIEAAHVRRTDARIVHIGPDPHFARMPVRGYRSDLAIAADPVAAIAALDAAATPGPDASLRRDRLAAQAVARRNTADKVARSGATEPMTAEWMSACISDAMDETAIAFSELGLLPAYMSLKGPNRLFGNVHAGGLGWAMPAALGAQLADRDRLVIAAMGDGSYMFANPVACHQIAEALDLPILTIVKNNATWNAVRRSVADSYPDGAAVRANQMPLTSLAPVPDFSAIARASRAHAELVERGADLPGALDRALAVIRTERRQALIDVRVALSDTN